MPAGLLRQRVGQRVRRSQDGGVAEADERGAGRHRGLGDLSSGHRIFW